MYFKILSALVGHSLYIYIKDKTLDMFLFKHKMIVNVTKWILFMFVIIKGQLLDNSTLENDNTTAVLRRTHQITAILDGLLKDYDANIRPNFGGKKKLL
jgi:hypothetical protein